MDDTIRNVTCKVCGHETVFSATELEAPLSFVNCDVCKFPVAYFDAEKAFDSSIVIEYIYEAEKIFRKDYQKKCSEDDLLVEASNDKARKSSTRKAQTGQSDLSTALISHQELEKLFEKLIAKNTVIADLKRRTEKLESILSSSSGLSTLESQNLDPARKSDPEQALKRQTTSRHSYSNEAATVRGYNDEFSEKTIRQQQGSNAQWIDLYNKNPEAFLRSYASGVKRAGATHESLESARLAQDSNALFKIGNGSYWLLQSSSIDIAFLMPNGKAFRFNQNVLDSLKTGFCLTHHFSLDDSDFNPKIADYDHVQMIFPATLKSLEDDLWQIQSKGVLLFPIKTEN